MLGDGLPNSGTQGSYFKYQYGVLKLLEQISGFGGGSATAANQVIEIGVLNNILSALQSGQEFEQNMVTDLGGVGCPANCPTYLEIRIFNSVTHTFDPPIYYNAAGAVVVPVGPLQYVNPQFVLENILTQVTAINSNTTGINLEATQAAIQALLTTIDADTSNLDVALSTRASAANQTTLGAQTTKINDGTNTAAVKAASTAPLATDPALVVTISPNSTVGITTSSTSTNTSVARATTVGGVTLLAANANRKGATITNDSGAIMYVLFAVTGTVSSTVYTVRLGANDYYEVPFGYTGAISGIWASAGAGNALMSELT